MSVEHSEEALRQARLAQVRAEGGVLDLQSLVETLERQRDRADGMLAAVMAYVREDKRDTLAVRNASKYLEEIAGMDKWERRL